MRVLVLRHHLEDNPGLIGAALIARGATLDVVLVEPGRALPALDPYNLLVLLGSKAAVYDPAVQASWFNDELALIAQADQRGLPIFGICFGAQALCVFGGGAVAPAAEAEIGWTAVESCYDGLASGEWFSFHYDACTLPDHATVWAHSPRAVQAFALGRHVGVQFHPEIDAAQLHDWLEADPSDVRYFGQSAAALLASTKDREPDLRVRADALVQAVLKHNGLSSRGMRLPD